MKELRDKIIRVGIKFPKKHGSWYRVHTYENNYLVLDTWNNTVYHHKDCDSTGTNNMYNVVYTFTGRVGYIRDNMANFWRAHISN